MAPDSRTPALEELLSVIDDLVVLIDDLGLYLLATPAPQGSAQENDRQRLIAEIDRVRYGEAQDGS